MQNVTLSLRPQKYTPVGILVMIQNRPYVVTPNAEPVCKSGTCRFWFYHYGKALLAERAPRQSTYVVR